MGQEESSPINDSVPPSSLAGRTVEALAEYIKSGKAEKVVVMTGAGIKTGLYANLARLNLPYAEAVFEINYFRQNPEPFYTLAHELYPGKYRPTIAHSFIRLLDDKGLLLKHFTQNIDCLDREAGVPGDKIVEAHGSFARQSCIDCSMPYPEVDIKRHIDAKTIPKCEHCKGLVKPEIVFFGEQLPADFFRNRSLPSEADLCIVMGTSLTVQPFASLPSMVKESTPRVLINKERVGGIGSGADDVLLLGDCDDGVRKLAKACGWLDELEALWARTAPAQAAQSHTEAKDKDQVLEDEIDKLTKDVDKTLDLSRWLDQRVRNEKRATPPQFSKSQHGFENGNLNHVFVSENQKSALSETPVIPKESSKASDEVKVGSGQREEENDKPSTKDVKE
ncbi:Sir2 histone deacetylase Hst2 [Vermiconidia calcicola]|uniref:Sir2 histone deacetylase Hst2 n=1 Tax=Vermiconidia calcicola TaxID=1690605 RepID=A0ACC3NWH4_9PEZI|nr:Sir2 histone deacetylase Hst2 [Vermiconidia calcicola]